MSSVFNRTLLFIHIQLDFQTKFALYDKRGDGNIGPDELGDALRACGLNPSAAEVDAISKGFAGEIHFESSK